MSAHESTFTFPFISNLVSNKSSERTTPFHQRVTSMKEKTLCLDDDPLSLRLVEHLLKKRYEVISCPTIDAAIKAVQIHKISLFLCDYHLGEHFTGARANQILTRKYRFNPMHRILITSYPSQEIEGEALKSGFEKVFAKPLRQDFQNYCLNLWRPPAKQSIAAS
jgi:response regulator RpfG family c-di-GMP phosphodiesterase